MIGRALRDLLLQTMLQPHATVGDRHSAAMAAAGGRDYVKIFGIDVYEDRSSIIAGMTGFTCRKPTDAELGSRRAVDCGPSTVREVADALGRDPHTRPSSSSANHGRQGAGPARRVGTDARLAALAESPTGRRGTSSAICSRAFRGSAAQLVLHAFRGARVSRRADRNSRPDRQASGRTPMAPWIASPDGRCSTSSGRGPPSASRRPSGSGLRSALTCGT